MKNVTITIRGKSPLMMHNDRLANPLDKYTKQLKTYTSKREKTDEDYEAMAQIEFFGGLYCNNNGPYIPAQNFRKCVVEGGTTIKKGTAIKKAVFIVEDSLPLIYDGPRDAKAMYASGRFIDSRMVGTTNKVRVLRTRPQFPTPWGFIVTMSFDPAEINEADLRTSVERAGEFCGLGDYRPGKSGGSFGRFVIEDWK